MAVQNEECLQKGDKDVIILYFCTDEKPKREHTMEYKKITVTLNPYNETASEVMMAQMGDLGFESFCEIEEGFEGYIPSKKFESQMMDSVETYVDGVTFAWSEEVVPDQDWNAEWEKNYFTPIVVDDKCLIRSTFHEKSVDVEYEIIINPQMSFGTGHHETTCMMMRFILENDMKDKEILDMGCGTGILGILTSMCGARKVMGIDIDEWCYNNTLDNMKLNDITNMSVVVGGAEALTADMSYDVVLANINRNILLDDMSKYVSVLKAGGKLIMSGFYQSDKTYIEQKAAELGLRKDSEKEQNNWTALSFVK